MYSRFQAAAGEVAAIWLRRGVRLAIESLAMLKFIRRRRPAVAGLIIGSLVGLVAALAYGLTSGWLCSGIRNCPVSWQPFVLVSSIFFVVPTILGSITATVGVRLYRIFDTALGGGGKGTSSERSGESG